MQAELAKINIAYLNHELKTIYPESSKQINENDKKRIEFFFNEVASVNFFLFKIKNNKKSVKEKEIFKLLNEIFKKAEEFERQLDNQVLISGIKKIFRNFLKDILFCSNLIRYSSEKPKRYPGDYKIIEAIYNNKPISKGFGYILDRYLLQNIYAEAIRYRKDFACKFLKNTIENNQKHTISILNLACGSCREIRELFSKQYFPNKKILFYLIDKDADTINYCNKELKPFNLQFNYACLCSDVIKFLKDNLTPNINHQLFDLIYCIGLADYLPDVLLRALIKYSVLNLNRGGKFLLAHKNTKLYSFSVSDWAANWKFIARNKNDISILIQDGIEGQNVECEFLTHSNNPILFIVITKK